eukprot:150498-Prorocentrum_minimum.AAC.1
MGRMLLHAVCQCRGPLAGCITAGVPWLGASVSGSPGWVCQCRGPLAGCITAGVPWLGVPRRCFQPPSTRRVRARVSTHGRRCVMTRAPSTMTMT